MANTQVWPTVHAERKALAAELGGLDDAKWQTRSMCDQWTVQQLLSHMTATAKMTPGKFFPTLIGSGFKFDKLTQKGVEAELGSSPMETLARFNAVLDATTHPPGPLDTVLGETIVHGEDIRRPLGLTHDYPTAAVVQVADFYKGSNLIVGAKKRIAGLTLRATDTAWTTGSGPEVAGPILSLVLAMTGRLAALSDLSGDGAATLRSRMG